ncbi:hypothetical protein AGMMS50229_13630 [Campylobacterota bacterium]|nr:hypothetical protein AGMMS50229_13630 [Campylobacterota bacterium]
MTSDIRDELLGGVGSRPLLRLRHFVLLLVIGSVGFYIYYLLYGGNSLMRLLQLYDEEQALNDRIVQLQDENARLRKELYELKLIFDEQ